MLADNLCVRLITLTFRQKPYLGTIIIILNAHSIVFSCWVFNFFENIKNNHPDKSILKLIVREVLHATYSLNISAMKMIKKIRKCCFVFKREKNLKSHATVPLMLYIFCILLPECSTCLSAILINKSNFVSQLYMYRMYSVLRNKYEYKRLRTYPFPNYVDPV